LNRLFRSAKLRDVAHSGISALGVGLTLLACGAQDAGIRPNVLLVTLDTTRADRLTLYGHARPTSPNLDTLGRESIVFENAYSTSSWTLPAHASLFTGKFPSSHGVRHDPEGPLVLADAIQAPQGVRARPMHPDEETLARILSRAGYTTAGFVGGPWLIREFGLGAGFELWDDSGIADNAGRRARDVSDAALAWLDGGAREPFFLFLNYFDPHAPYLPPPEWAVSFLPQGLRPDPLSAAQAPALYDAEILYMDHELGRVLSWLRERGVFERTLVVVTSDHGELLGERGDWGHERFLWEPLVRVPLLVKPPGEERPGRRERRRVSLVDLLPLILEELSLETPRGVSGEPPPASRRPLLAEVNPLGAGGTGDWRGLWEGRFKYLENSLGERYLYDLEADPEESRNLVELEPRHAEAAAAALEEAFASLPPPPPAGPGGRVGENVRRALETLGYLSSQEAPQGSARSETGGAPE
jgi:arylsulfatase A-like enzyme